MPTTVPTEAILSHSIHMLAGGNSIVFMLHPRAARVSTHCVRLLKKALHEAGAPANAIVTFEDPTIAKTQALMNHKGIDLLVVTGGGAVVRAAMASSKRAICVGPGNTPVIVDSDSDYSERRRRHCARRIICNNI